MVSPQEFLLQRIENLARRRTETDRRMGYIWMIIPLLPVAAAVAIGATAVGMAASLLPRIGNLSHQAPTQSLIAPIVGGIVTIYAVAALALFVVWFFGALSFYYLMDRRNRHFARQHLLFAAIHRYLELKAPESENVLQLGYFAEDSTSEEQARPAGLWALVFLLVGPIVGLIASYSLTQDMRRHDVLQSRYGTALISSMTDVGLHPANLPPYRTRNRDPMLFTILSVITGGLFWIYWYYTLLNDYNGHFEDQARFEDQVLITLTPPQVPKTCPACGGLVPRTARFCPNCGSKANGLGE